MAHEINPLLLDMAAWRLNAAAEKAAFVPSEAVAGAGGGDPAAAAAGAPADPAAAGDPAAAAGGDPAAMGGAPPMGGPAPPSPGGAGAPADPMAAMMPMIQQIVQQTVQQVMMQQGGGGAPGAPGAAGGAGGAAGGKAKIDPAFIYQELSRVRKMLSGVFEQQGWPLPPDILDDPAVGALAMGQQPQSAPIGAEGGGMPGGAPPVDPAAAGGEGFPGLGSAAPITPIQPPKQASDILGFPDVFGFPTPDKLAEQEVRLQAVARLARQQHVT